MSKIEKKKLELRIPKTFYDKIEVEAQKKLLTPHQYIRLLISSHFNTESSK